METHIVIGIIFCESPEILDKREKNCYNDGNDFLRKDTTMQFVSYRDFGAVGDGKTDDFAAIIAAHAHANEAGLPVRADEGDTYYIGNNRTASAYIKTDTDWTGASFIIDDSKVDIDHRSTPIFIVNDDMESIDLTEYGVKSLCEGQRSVVSVGRDCYVRVTHPDKRIFIRKGPNQNAGSLQNDCFILRANGLVDEKTPIIWNFDRIQTITAKPLPEKTLTLRGGKFTHIANQAESKITYYDSGINITRSRVCVEGISHYIEGELDHGAPYSGFLGINHCAEVEVKNCLFTAHRTYITYRAENKPVPMGTYDLGFGSAIGIKIENCSQTTDIMDRAYWGLICSNFCKDITLINCKFSRFDAHMGMTNATIRGCTLGHQCLNAIGHGLLTVEDSTLFGDCFIYLRFDYGSTWKGDMIIKNCTWLPAFRNGKANFIGGANHGDHDFGYECYMPQHILVDGLHVKDADESSNPEYNGVYMLGNITRENTDESFSYVYPYHITKTLTIRNFTSDSGKLWQLSENPFMYRNTELL